MVSLSASSIMIHRAPEEGDKLSLNWQPLLRKLALLGLRRFLALQSSL